MFQYYATVTIEPKNVGHIFTCFSRTRIYSNACSLTYCKYELSHLVKVTSVFESSCPSAGLRINSVYPEDGEAIKREVAEPQTRVRHQAETDKQITWSEAEDGDQ